MFSYRKLFKQQLEKNRELQTKIDNNLDRVRDLELQLIMTREELGNPKYVIEKIFNKSPKFFDYSNLSPEDLKMYYNEAQMILSSRVFNNELNMLRATFAQDALIAAKDFRQVRDAQMTINGFEFLEQRLKNISPPGEKPTVKNPHSAI